MGLTTTIITQATDLHLLQATQIRDTTTTHTSNSHTTEQMGQLTANMDKIMDTLITTKLTKTLQTVALAWELFAALAAYYLYADDSFRSIIHLKTRK